MILSSGFLSPLLQIENLEHVSLADTVVVSVSLTKLCAPSLAILTVTPQIWSSRPFITVSILPSFHNPQGNVHSWRILLV